MYRFTPGPGQYASGARLRPAPSRSGPWCIRFYSQKVLGVRSGATLGRMAFFPDKTASSQDPGPPEVVLGVAGAPQAPARSGRCAFRALPPVLPVLSISAQALLSPKYALSAYSLPQIPVASLLNRRQIGAIWPRGRVMNPLNTRSARPDVPRSPTVYRALPAYDGNR